MEMAEPELPALSARTRIPNSAATAITSSSHEIAAPSQLSIRIVGCVSFGIGSHRTRLDASVAAIKQRPIVARTAFGSAEVDPRSSNAPLISNTLPAARAAGASSAFIRRTIGPNSSGVRATRPKPRSASDIVITASSCSEAAIAKLATAEAATFGFVERDRTTSRFTDAPFSAPLSSCAARPQICCSVSSQRASAFTRVELIAQLRIVWRGRDRHRFSRIEPVNRRGLHELRHDGRRLSDRQLVEEKGELLVVCLAERRL